MSESCTEKLLASTSIPESPSPNTMEYTARNYAQLAPIIYGDLDRKGIAMNSRNGPVKRLPGVTTIVIERPWERVNFSPVRNANPFFHLTEAMAMLAGVNSVRLMAFFAKNMATFSDNGTTYNAFYGTRLRRTWGDQLNLIVKELTENPESRQCVAQMWDPSDLTRKTKDKACNLCLMFDVNSATGQLCMTSINRSNDAIWGIVTGANVVHLSFFQEYVACALGRAIGPWTHVSNNLHVYTENPQWLALLKDPQPYDYYTMGVRSDVRLFPSPDHRGMFDALCEGMMSYCDTAVFNDSPPRLTNGAAVTVVPFLLRTVVPVFQAWWARKHDASSAVVAQMLQEVQAEDWRVACLEWLRRADERGGAK